MLILILIFNPDSNSLSLVLGQDLEPIKMNLAGEPEEDNPHQLLTSFPGLVPMVQDRDLFLPGTGLGLYLPETGLTQ